MNKLDNYIMGNLNSYLFSKYGYDDYGILKMEFRDRFIVLSECNISNILSRDRQSTFLGMLDKETNILYLESFYYNHLNDNSEFQKKLLNEVQHEMEDYVKDRYNQYIKTNELQIADVYGSIGYMDDDGMIYDNDLFNKSMKLQTTGVDRTGCVFCMFGIKQDTEKFLRLKELEPKKYDFVMRGGKFDENGMWMPHNGLGYKFVIDWLNEHGGLNIRY